ncbi:MAG TPA: histidine phosphatase family protein [Intrasporangium sp.]|uniref:histidine phosphatase family protein n=1 Tax=Intrasporangium sp. TaxID=1925024 RepID=UPI002D7A3C1C|nr:histidine phosphatase family protein [Intrasporangium sp.]HET7397702.1 histidine phosphatase family protein [Intrasporangium sp.]
MHTPDGIVPGSLVLVRHGETEWSRSGQHTGVTDLPLLPDGERAATRLAAALAEYSFVRVLVSPLQRARRTAQLAGLSDVEIDPRLVEWDYGAYEGLTTPEIRERLGHAWEVFNDPIEPGETPGESLSEVAQRAQSVLDDVVPELARGDVAVFGHGHALRILAAVYLGVDPAFGAQLVLDAGSISALTHHRATRCIGAWNLTPGNALPA